MIKVTRFRLEIVVNEPDAEKLTVKDALDQALRWIEENEPTAGWGPIDHYYEWHNRICVVFER